MNPETKPTQKVLLQLFHRLRPQLLWTRLLRLQEGPPQLLFRDHHTLSDITN